MSLPRPFAYSWRRVAALTCGSAALLTWALPAGAVTGVATEAVNIFNGGSCYTYCDTPCNNLCYCVAEADDFRNTLLGASGTIFTSDIRYIDLNVWDTDFFDPDLDTYVSNGRSSWDDDTANSDHSSAALGFFSMHGTCNDINASQTCTSASNCSTGGACILNGPDTTGGYCAYATPRLIIVNSYRPEDHYYGAVNYSTDTVRWGESSHSGGWSHAGQNGNLNWAFIDVSCGVRDPFYDQELYDMFAGLHGLGITMPTSKGSDTEDTTGRGYYAAQAYTVNPSGSVAEAWRDSLASDPQSDGGACPYEAPDYTYGGGRGYSGCGANTSMAVDLSSSNAYTHLTEDWAQSIDDSTDAQGNGYYYYWYLCNYDCNTYPPSN